MEICQRSSGPSTSDVAASTPAEVRALCIEELQKVNAELRAAKLELSAARQAGARGRYLPPVQFYNLCLRVDSLGNCDGTLRKSQAILARMDEDAATILAYCRGRGGHCDCEVLLNVAEDEI